jgi:tRNA(Ile)-lysidine synthase
VLVPGLINKVTASIKKHSMLYGGETVLIGLSGGPDSVCLFHVLNSLRDRYDLGLHAIYIDHGLRPGETEQEKEFCRNLCDTFNVPFITKSVDVKSHAKEHKLNIQDAARQLRYAIYHETSYDIQAHKIALGHTADDQAGTS